MRIPNHIASGFAHYLGKVVVQIMASEEAMQATFETPPTAMIGFWADHFSRAMAGTIWTPPRLRHQPRRRSHITDRAARQLLQGTRPHVRATYTRRRRLGDSPRAALDAALRSLSEGKRGAA